MNKIRIGFAAVVLITGCAAVFAQGDKPVPRNDFAGNDAQTDAPDRGNILRRELQLTPEQMVRIRQINGDSRRNMVAAQQRFQLARRDLDRTIYADDLVEEELQQRVRNVVEAQAEVTKIRAMSEVAVRTVLTPEQLVRFRELRQRFAREEEQRRLKQRRRENMRRRGANPTDRRKPVEKQP